MAFSCSHILCGSLLPTLALDSSAGYSRLLVQTPMYSKRQCPSTIPTFFMAPQLSQDPSSPPQVPFLAPHHLLTAHPLSFSLSPLPRRQPLVPQALPSPALAVSGVLTGLPHVPSNSITAPYGATAPRPLSLSLLPGCQDLVSEVQRLLHLRPGFLPYRILSLCHEAPGG